MASRGVNKVILVGNVGKDPEMRYLPSGGAVANLTLATSETWKDKNTGQNQEKTEWHRLVAFNRLAEIIGEYVRKGSKLYIEGKLQTRSWEQDGVTRYATEIVINEMQMLDSRGSGGDQNSGGDYSQQSQPSQQSRPAPAQGGPGLPDTPGAGGGQPSRPSDFDNFDDDIPF